MADMITKQELEAAKLDVKHAGEAVNEKKVVNPRYGESFYSLPLAIQIVLESGGFEPFATEAQLLASTPILKKKAAKALNTGKVWLWENGTWKDTGLSELDQAKTYADSNPNFKSVSLKDTDNLDDVKASGTYTALNSLIADPTRNYPEKTGGTLRVSRHGTSNSIQQEYLTITGQIYSRRYISSWSSWVKQSSSAELEQAKEQLIADASTKSALALTEAKADSKAKADAVLIEAKGYADQGQIDVKGLVASNINRPGDALSLFSSALVGDDNVGFSTSENVITSTIANVGKVSKFKNVASYIASRSAPAIYSDRKYQAKFSLIRTVNSADPLNDAIELGVEFLNHNKQSVSHKILEVLSVKTASGLVKKVYDLEPGPAIYARPWIRIFGQDSETAIVYLDIVDVTEIKDTINYIDSNPNLKSVSLKDTDNLDDFKSPGTYTALSSLIADPTRNYPEKTGGTLRVSKHGNYNTVQQEYLTITGQIYSRRYISSWSSWVKQASYAELEKVNSEALVNRGVVSKSSISNLTDIGTYSVSEMEDFPSDFPATYGILKRYKFGTYAYWELSTTSRPDIVWQKVGVAAWRKFSIDDVVKGLENKDSLTLNRDKLYPVIALTRGGVAADTSVQALERHILDAKVNGANPDYYYRISYFGNNSTLTSEANKFGWILQEISKEGFQESGGTVRALTSAATTKYEIVPNSGIVQFTLRSTVDTNISFDLVVDTTDFDQSVLHSHAVLTSKAWGHIIDPFKYVMKQDVDMSIIDGKIGDRIDENNRKIETLPTLPTITATSAGLVAIDSAGNADYSNLLFSKSVSSYVSPASITKVMSAIVALESGMSLDSMLITTTADIIAGSGNNLLEGDQISLLDALFNMMLPSSNTAANLVARSVGAFLGGDLDTFIAAMNSKATEIGMVGTTFKNASGLAAAGHRSTVIDMLRLGAYASKNETMRSIWGKASHTITVKGPKPRNVDIESSVVPVVSGEPWAIGGKTGTLAPSVYNILLFVRLRNGFTGISVIAAAPSNANRYNDLESVVDYARNAFAYPAPPKVVLKT